MIALVQKLPTPCDHRMAGIRCTLAQGHDGPHDHLGPTECGNQHNSGRVCTLPAGHDGHHYDAEGIHWSPNPEEWTWSGSR